MHGQRYGLWKRGRTKVLWQRILVALLLGKIARFTLRVYSGQTLQTSGTTVLRETLRFFRSVGGKELGVGLQQGSGVFSEMIFQTVSRSDTV